MPLSFLLDENLSPIVAERMSKKRPDIPVRSIHHWREGEYLSVPDLLILEAAHEDGLTLVTYDTQILSELAYRFEEEVPFGGLIFVDDNTVLPNDFGRLVKALIHLWDAQSEMDWTNRLVYLPSPPR